MHVCLQHKQTVFQCTIYDKCNKKFGSIVAKYDQLILLCIFYSFISFSKMLCNYCKEAAK